MIANYIKGGQALSVPFLKQDLENHLKIEIETWIYDTSFAGNIYSASGIDTGITPVSAFTDGQRITLLIKETNTGNTSVEIDINPSVSLLDYAGNNFVAGGLTVGLHSFAYDLANTRFLEVNTDLESNLYTTLLSIIDNFSLYLKQDILETNYSLYLETISVTPLELKRAPLLAIQGLYYLDTAGVWQPLTFTQDLVRTYPYNKLRLLDVPSHSNVTSLTEKYRIDFTTGLGSTIQADIAQAILMTLASLLEHNGACLDAAGGCACDMAQIPPQSKNILNRYRIQEIY